MKKLKKLTAIVMAGAMALTVSAASTQGKEDAWAAELAKSGKAGANATWTISEDGTTVTISGTGDMGNEYGSITMPDYNSWDEYEKIIETVRKVTKAVVQDGIQGAQGFNFWFNLEEISLADSVNKIGWGGFGGMDNLKKVSLPNSLIEIEYWAFSGCSSLPEITIPGSVTKIGDSAFHGCSSLKNVKLPNNVTTVAYETFYKCSSLPEVTVPYAVNSIEEHAFGNCFSLKTIHFEGDAPAFAYNAFDGVTATVYYPLENSTWTADKQQNYGGNLTWIPKSLAESLAIVSEGTAADYVIGGGKDASFQSTGPLKYFTGISVDGVLLNAADYKLDTGSNAVIILAQYLDKLPSGDHTVTLNYTYGSVSTVLKVKTAAEANSRTGITGGNPKTADNSHVMVWMVVSMLSAGGLCLSVVKRRKESK